MIIEEMAKNSGEKDVQIAKLTDALANVVVSGVIGFLR